MTKIWIVVEIDNYGGDMLDCWCTFDNFSDLHICYSKEEADKKYDEIEKGFARSARVIEKEIKIVK